MTGRHSIWRALIVVIATVLATVAFIVAALMVGPEIQILIVRGVFVSLIIFVTILFLRYFALLWFAYLGHAERNILGVREVHQLPPVSILIPAYNEGEVMERALTSMMQITTPSTRSSSSTMARRTTRYCSLRSGRANAGPASSASSRSRTVARRRRSTRESHTPSTRSSSAWTPTRP